VIDNNTFANVVWIGWVDEMELLDQQIIRVNEELKGTGVKIRRRHNRFYLRATLPPKPHSENQNSSRQEISLKIKAIPENIHLIEREARLLSIRLAKKEFIWEDYGVTVVDAIPTIQEIIEEMEEDYFNRHQRHKSQDSWKNDYAIVFRQLPLNEILTAKIIKNTIIKSEPNSRNRRRYCLALAALARKAKIDFDFKPWVGNYSPRSVRPRDIPTDKQIIDWYHRIENPQWRWAFGVMAAYGLRNHEIFRIDFEALKQDSIVTVLDGKTGFRRVWPFYVEWVEYFNLQSVAVPSCDLSRTNSALGHQVTQFFRKNDIPFAPYSLRHRWAIRTLEMGLDVSLAARQMGHAVQVHTLCYHHWIDEAVHQRAYERVLAKENRPRPPS
jgi:hypothetical protein